MKLLARNFYHLRYACMYVGILYLLFGSCCQDVSSFGRRAIYIHTYYFIFYLVLAAKMCHLLVAPAKMFHLLVGEPYTCILFILVLAAKMCHLSVAPAKMFHLLVGEPYTSIHFLVLAANMYHLLVAPAKMFHLSVGELYACTFYHIHASFGFCMAAVAVIISCRCGHNTNVHHRN